MFTGLTTYHIGAIVGLALGDATLASDHATQATARVSFSQSIIHYPYVLHISMLLSPFTKGLPTMSLRRLGGKVFASFVVATRTYAVLGDLYRAFHLNGKKIVPDDIYNLFTDVALAHWIMCDGSRLTAGGLLFCTDSFTPKDVVSLMNVLRIKWGIESSLDYYAGLPRIRVPRKEVHKIRAIVTPYMIPHFMYKLAD